MKLSGIRFSDVWYFGLAVVYLSFCQFLIAFVPFQKYYPLFVDKKPEQSVPITDEKILVVRKALLRGMKRIPWKARCLAQALTGKLLLRKLHLPGTIYLGIAKETGKLEAHAWLICGNQFISGKEGHKKFTVVQAIS